MPHDIFISYVEEDGETARGLAEALHAQGQSTWTYQQDGAPGISYLTQVNEAVEACRAFVLLASAGSVRAHQVIREVEQAHEREKPIIVVRLGLTHPQFIASNPILRMASGTGVTLGVETGSLADIARRITLSLARTGGAPGLPGSIEAVYAPPDIVVAPSPMPATPRPRGLQQVVLPTWLWVIVSMSLAVQVLLGGVWMLGSWWDAYERFAYPSLRGEQGRAGGWPIIPLALSATAMAVAAIFLARSFVALRRALRRKQTPRIPPVKWALFASAAAWIADLVVIARTPSEYLPSDIVEAFFILAVPVAVGIGVSWAGYWIVKERWEDLAAGTGTERASP
jgi:hypothetical protein